MAQTVTECLAAGTDSVTLINDIKLMAKNQLMLVVQQKQTLLL